jgi:hypothetical protein
LDFNSNLRRYNEATPAPTNKPDGGGGLNKLQSKIKDVESQLQALRALSTTAKY